MVLLHLLLLHLEKTQNPTFILRTLSELFNCSQIFGFTDHYYLDWLIITTLMGALEKKINSKDKEIAKASSKSNFLLMLISLLLASADQCVLGCKNQTGDNFSLLLFFLVYFQSQVRILHSSQLCLVQVDNITIYEHASYLADLLYQEIPWKIHPVFTR